MQRIETKPSFISSVLLLLGFFSFFAIPQYHGIKLFHILLGVSFTFLLLACPRLRVRKEDRVYIALLFLFFACAIIGAIRKKSGDGILSAFLFLVYFFVVTIAVQSRRIMPLVSGLFHGAVFVAAFIILDEICHYALRFSSSLITYILPDALLESKGHQLTNYVYLFGSFLYRPSGFAWDPGMTVPGLFLMYVLNNEYKLFVKRKIASDIILVAAIVLSISKTAIIALGAYWLFKLFIFTRRSKNKNRKWLYILIIVGGIAILIYAGSGIEYDGLNGNQRHLKYFWSLRYYFRADVLSILFGYGFRNTGSFFNNYVPWLSGYGFAEDAVVESTITNIFLYGGLIGALYWIDYAYKIINSKNGRCICMLLMMIILSCGYSIVSCWYYLLLNIVFFLAIDKDGQLSPTAVG